MSESADDPEASPGSRQLLKLYRAVCEAEAEDLLHTGELRTVPGSVEGKWFAQSEADAAAWGAAFARISGAPHRKIVMVEITPTLLTRFFYVARLDNIGPAFFATIETS